MLLFGDRMHANAEQLFVYGTLMPGHCNYTHIRDYVLDCVSARLSGQLIHRGRSPGLVEGDGIVRGQLLCVTPEALGVTDEIEQFIPGSASSVYLRKRLRVWKTTGDLVLAWTYVLADPPRVAHRPTCAVDVERGKTVYQWRGR